MGQRKSPFAGNLNIYAKYVTAGSSSNQIYQDCLMAGSSSQSAIETAYPANGNRTNLGNTYLSSATVQKTYSTSSYSVQYPTNTSDWTVINGVLTSPKNQ